MFRYVSGGLALALLLTVAGTPAPAPATAPSGAQAVTLKVQREYGDGPVTITPGVERLRLAFHGRKGNTVALNETATRDGSCGNVSLRGPSGKVERWLRGAWRLPASGRYSFVVTRCDAKHKAVAQLTKIRLRQLRADGEARVVKPGGGGAFEVWTTVVVPRRGRVQVRPTAPPSEAPWCAMYLEDAPMLNIATWHQEIERAPQAIYVEAGVPVSNEQGTMALATGELLVPQQVNGPCWFPARSGSGPAPPRPIRCPGCSTARP